MFSRTALVRATSLGFVTAPLFVAAGPAAPRSSLSSYPNGIVVMGHSGATGYDSDPQSPGVDAPENSWATGSNPAVNSLYQRILARNPAIRGHALNVARDGSDVNDLMRQARLAVASKPVPGLFVIQSVDHDIHCDGTDAQNYGPYAATLTRTLEFIKRRAPNARVFMISQWATVKNYTNAIKTIAAKRAAESGNELCSVFDPSGRLRPAGMTALQKIVNAYHARIAATCTPARNCKYDRGALQRMTIVASDLSPDANHLSIQGLRKMAAVAWAALY